MSSVPAPHPACGGAVRLWHICGGLCDVSACVDDRFHVAPVSGLPYGVSLPQSPCSLLLASSLHLEHMPAQSPCLLLHDNLGLFLGRQKRASSLPPSWWVGGPLSSQVCQVPLLTPPAVGHSGLYHRTSCITTSFLSILESFCLALEASSLMDHFLDKIAKTSFHSLSVSSLSHETSHSCLAMTYQSG